MTHIKVYNPNEMLKARLKSMEFARRNITMEQAHKQMRKNGSIPQKNPWKR